MSPRTVTLPPAEPAMWREILARAHRGGLTSEQLREWYGVAESIPLSQRHAGHLIKQASRGGRSMNSNSGLWRSQGGKT
jgi:hypothetical protein